MKADAATYPIFELKFGDATARGCIAPDGFKVLAGSTALRQGTATRKRDRDERDRLVRTGILVEHGSRDLFVFARDHTCTSASQAAGIVKDGNASGPQPWRDPTTNLTLKEHIQVAAK